MKKMISIVGVCVLSGLPVWAQGPANPPPVPPQQQMDPFGLGLNLGGSFDLGNMEDLGQMIEQFQGMMEGGNFNFDFKQLGGGQRPVGPHTYLGVKLAPVHPDVAHHLDLPVGFYQNVRVVDPGSPADNAGLLAMDIITQVDDQKIINAQQLTQLIAEKSDGDTVAVKVLRKGKEVAVTVTLAQREGRGRAMPGGLPQPGNFQDMIRQLQGQFGQMQPPRPQMGRGGPGVVIEEDADGNKTTRVEQSSRSSMMHTEQGQFTFSEENGTKHFKVVDPDGKVAFDGPVNSKTERSAVPPEFQNQLERMDAGGGGGGLRPQPGRRHAPVAPKQKRMPI